MCWYPLNTVDWSNGNPWGDFQRAARWRPVFWWGGVLCLSFCASIHPCWFVLQKQAGATKNGSQASLQLRISHPFILQEAGPHGRKDAILWLNPEHRGEGASRCARGICQGPSTPASPLAADSIWSSASHLPALSASFRDHLALLCVTSSTVVLTFGGTLELSGELCR